MVDHFAQVTPKALDRRRRPPSPAAAAMSALVEEDHSRPVSQHRTLTLVHLQPRREPMCEDDGDRGIGGSVGLDVQEHAIVGLHAEREAALTSGDLPNAPRPRRRCAGDERSPQRGGRQRCGALAQAA